MTSFLGIRTPPRQSSLAFKSIGQHFRNGQKVSEITPTFKFSNDGDTDPFYQYPAAFMSSVVEKEPVLAGIGLGYSLKKMVGQFNPPSVVAFGAKTRLDKILTEELGLVEGVGAGNYKYGYYSDKRLPLADMKSIFGQLDFANCSSDTGFRSRGLCKQAVEVMATLDRLVTGYLMAANTVHNIEYQHSFEEPETGWTRVDVHISVDEAQKTTYSEGSVTIGTQYSENHALVENSSRLSAFLELSYVQLPQYAPDSSNLRYGHAFRFVPGTLPSDGEYYGRLVLRHFSDFFDNASKALSVSQAIIRHVPSIRNSGVRAEELLFAVIMMGCSLESGAKVKLISEGNRMLGAVLQTYEPMLHDGNLVEYLDDDSLMSAVGSWTTSSKAREIVASALSGLNLRARVEKLLCTPGMIDTSTKLLTQIAMRRRMSTFADDFVNALPYLGYSFEAISATTDNIIQCLKLISDGKPSENIFWCKEIFQHESTIISSQLSSFGPSSVSFQNPNGTYIRIYANAKDDPKTKEKKEKIIEAVGTAKKGKKRIVELKKETVKFWDRITVSRVSIEAAFRDFEDLRVEHRIRQVVGYDSRILGTVDIHPIEDDNSLLGALRLFGGTFEGETERTMPIRESTEGVSLKKTRFDEDLGMDL